MVKTGLRHLFFLSVAAMLGVMLGVAKADDWVLRAGDIRITADQVQFEIDRIRAVRGLEDAPPPEQVLELTRSLYQVHALAATAREQGLDTRPEVEAAIQSAERSILANALLQEHQRGIKVPDMEQAARDHYDTRPEEFRVPERIMASHILFTLTCDCVDCDCLAERADKAAKAQEALERIRAGEPFALVAKEMSEDKQTADLGGSLGAWVTWEELDPRFAKTAFALPVGEVSEPVITRFGYHLIRVDQRAEAMVQPFEEVRDGLITQLGDQFRQAELARFTESFDAARQTDVELNQAAIERLLTELHEPGTDPETAATPAAAD